MDIEKVLDEYLHGDENKRMRLFLAFRDLRDSFIRIEQEVHPADRSVIRFPWSRRHRIAHAA